jgi:hypothetical protein
MLLPIHRLATTLLAAAAVCVLRFEADARAPVAGCGCGAPLYDCNENGIEDAVDIATGSSADADGNGVPDECQETRRAR